MASSRNLIWATLSLSAIALLAVRMKAQEPSADVVIFVLDDVADSDIDSISPSLLPSITQLAADGMRWRRFYAHAWCSPTRDSLLRAVTWGQGHGEWDCSSPVPESLDFTGYNMARMFKDAGYHTAHLGKWHLGVDAASTDWTQDIHTFGFDDTLVAFNIDGGCIAVPGTGQIVLTNGAFSRVIRSQMSAELRDAFLAWWAATPAPRFAVVNFDAPHHPWNYPTAGLLPQGYPTPLPGTDRERYEAELVGADTAIGQCLAVLGSEDWRLVIGDNGTPIGAERPDQDPTKIKATCYEDGVRVPLFVAGPGIVPGSEGLSLAHVSDLLPTLRDALGLTGPPVEGQLICSRDTLFCYSGPNQTAVIAPRWKLLTNGLGIEELYDLDNDPHELIPLPAVGPIAAFLRAERVSIIGY